MITVRVKSEKGDVIDFPVEPTRLSVFADNFCRTGVVRKKLFDKCLTFADHYMALDAKTKKLYDDIEAIRGDKFKGQTEMQNWCNAFTGDIVSSTDIIEFVKLAEQSANQVLFAIAANIIVENIESMTPQKFAEKFGIKNDFSPAELEGLDGEDKVWGKIPHEPTDEQHTLDETVDKTVSESDS